MFLALSMLENVPKTSPYPFRYNAEYRKVESEQAFKEESENEDDVESNSNGPPSHYEDSEGDDLSSLEAEQDGYC